MCGFVLHLFLSRSWFLSCKQFWHPTNPEATRREISGGWLGLQSQPGCLTGLEGGCQAERLVRQEKISRRPSRRDYGGFALFQYFRESSVSFSLLSWKGKAKSTLLFLKRYSKKLFGFQTFVGPSRKLGKSKARHHKSLLDLVSNLLMSEASWLPRLVRFAQCSL